MLPENLTTQEICQLIGYKELCNFSLGKQIEELAKQLHELRRPEGPQDAPIPSAE